MWDYCSAFKEGFTACTISSKSSRLIATRILRDLATVMRGCRTLVKTWSALLSPTGGTGRGGHAKGIGERDDAPVQAG